jgi:hypothetical protein
MAASFPLADGQANGSMPGSGIRNEPIVIGYIETGKGSYAFSDITGEKSQSKNEENSNNFNMLKIAQ